MHSFFKFFTERHLLANLFTVVVLIAGATKLASISRDTFPEVDFGEMIITTIYPGASPEDVELKVTNEIEDELKGVDGLDEYVSFSLENRSIISIKISPDEDLDEVKQEVRDAVDRVTDLPEEVDESPEVTELKTSIFPVIEIGATGDLPYTELREVARTLEKRIEDTPGVGRVERFGWRAREVKVEVDPKSIEQYQVSLGEIIEAISSRNIRSTGGAFESYTSEKNIVTLAQFEEPLDVGDVIVRSTFEGPSIKIKDLSIVRDDFEDADVESRINGRAAVSFIAYKASSADVIDTVDNLYDLIDEEQMRVPEGVELIVANDSSRYIRNRFKIVIQNGGIGLIFVVALLAIFLNIRTAFWVSISIPVTMLGTIYVIGAMGFHIDVIMLMAMILVIGIVVDDAIIISENIYREYEKGASPLEAGVLGIQNVYAPVLTTILTSFLAFAPMFIMPGTMGKFCFVIPLTVSIALFISLIEVTLALPAHLVPGMKKGNGTDRNWFDKVREPYERFMHVLLDGPVRYLMLAVFFLVLTGSGYFAFTQMNFVLFPSKTADLFNIEIELPTGSSLEATADKVRQIEALIAELPEGQLDSYASRIGRKSAEQFFSDERENYALISVFLAPYGQRDYLAQDLIKILREGSDKLEGFENIKYLIEGGGPPVGRPITLRVVGSDNELRRKLADEIEDYLGTIEAARDLSRDDQPGKEQIEIKLDYDKLARTGLTVQQVAQTVRTAYDGEIVTNVRYGEEDVDFRVQFTPEARQGLDYLKQLLVRNEEGRLVRLGKVAHFEVGPGPSNYYHYNAERAVTITGDVDKDVISPIQVTNKVIEKFDLNGTYRGMRIIVGGEAEESQKSIHDLLVTLGLAAIGIYFLLILLFNSIVQPLLVMIAVPFGISGVIITFALHNEPLSFLAMLGLIGLAGVVVNDSLVLVNHLNHLRKKHPEMSSIDVAARGASDRLRAIIMTSLTTVAGLMPLAYGIGGSDPFVSAMALALGWGIALATPLTVVLIPILYVVGDDLSQLLQRRR